MHNIQECTKRCGLSAVLKLHIGTLLFVFLICIMFFSTHEASATPTTVPSAPLNLQATGGTGKIILTWQAPSSNGGSAITGYKIYRSTSSGTETGYVSLGNVTSYTNTGLTNGITYFYKVRAVNSVGISPLSNETSATPIGTPFTPLNLQATGGTGKIILTWQAPSSNGGSAITGYKIYRSTSSGTETGYVSLGNVTSYTNTGLTNGITYFYKVRAVNSVGISPLSNETSATPIGTPFTPLNLQATGGTGKIILTWQAPSSNGGSAITGYKIYRSTSSGTETGYVSLGNVTSYTNTGLTNGITYFYKVRAVNSVGISPLSNETSATPIGTPFTPLNLQATGGTGKIILTWQAPSSNGGSAITGYKIYRSTSSGTETGYVSLGNVTSYTNTGLTNGITYFYKVRAVNSVGISPLSNETSATPIGTPFTPLNLQATGGTGKIILTWQAPSSNGGSAITGYKIYRSTSSGTETGYVSLGNVTSYTNTGLTNGITYFYKVRAVNSVGISPLSNETSATPIGTPFTPLNLQATGGTGKIILTWQAPSSNGGYAITGYKIYRSTSSGTETGYVSLGNVTSYTNTGLTNGITYFYKVRAVNSVGISPLSNEASATPFLTITLGATKTSVTPNPATTAIGKPITFNAKVLDSGSGTQSVPSGTVSWSDGGVGGSFNSTSCTLVPLNGSANSSICNISYMPPANAGKVTLTGSYSGDSTHSTSSGTSDLTVTLRTTKTTILPNPSTTAIGVPITFQTKVLDSNSGTKIIPTG